MEGFYKKNIGKNKSRYKQYVYRIVIAAPIIMKAMFLSFLAL